MSDDGSTNGALKNSHVTGENSEGVEFHGTVVRLTRFAVTFEIHNPAQVLRFSESLQNFKIIINGQPLYEGKAVVRNLMSTGPSVFTCEVTLNHDQWLLAAPVGDSQQFGRELGGKYQEFLGEWEKYYKLVPEFKIAVADIQTFLMELKQWLERTELSLRSLSQPDQTRHEAEMIQRLSPGINVALDALFEKYEQIVARLDEAAVPMHRWYVQRHLHGIVLCAPFAHRTYTKPLGYAGDYEMVNMIARNAPEGATLFAKLFNLWLLQQNSAVAHRNRITYLTRQLVENTLRMARQGQPLRVLSIGCGPAQEVQKLLAEQPLCNQIQFTLLDFNEETLRYVGDIMSDLKSRHQRSTTFQYIKKSVHHLLKDASRSTKAPPEQHYDFIYCAGLFDYLSNQVCKQLMNNFYEQLSPDGLVVATNVSPFTSNRGSLELILDWHLIYRDAAQLAAVRPDQASLEETRVVSEATSVNLFLETRKPHGN